MILISLNIKKHTHIHHIYDIIQKTQFTRLHACKQLEGTNNNSIDSLIISKLRHMRNLYMLNMQAYFKNKTPTYLHMYYDMENYHKLQRLLKTSTSRINIIKNRLNKTLQTKNKQIQACKNKNKKKNQGIDKLYETVEKTDQARESIPKR